MLIWHLFYKTQVLCGHYFTKSKSILATISKSPNSSLAKFYKDSKTQILVWQNLTNTQKPRYYPWQYYIKSPILFWQHLINAPKLLLF